MPTQTIELDELHPHPANSNVMPEHLLAKLVGHIARTGRYPPLIVRPMRADDTGASAYQILDGHHRAEALRRLNKHTAECIVWQADDQEAILLLATLNRLQGRDDPLRRAELIQALKHQHDAKTLARLLPERTDLIKKLLDLRAPIPAPRPPQPLQTMPVAVYFFLLPQQKRQLDERLRELGGTREEALMKLIKGDPRSLISNR